MRFGVIGTNWITERFIQAGMEHDDFVVSAVYSRTQEKGDQFANKYNIPMVFTDLVDMVSSDHIDAVYIASPNSLHADQAICCMNHRKHVLCEKPIAVNVVELRKMIDVARSNEVLLMEAMKSTVMPGYHVMKDNLYKIGRVRRYFASFCRYSQSYEDHHTGDIPNALNPKYAAGSLMDIGVYCIAPLVHLFGKPKSIEAISVLLPTGVDGEGSIAMGYDKMDAIIIHSKIGDSFLPAEIQGENGTMVIEKISAPQNVKIHYRDGTIEDLTKSQTHLPMYYEIQEFITLLNNRQYESSSNSHENSFIVMEVMDEVRRQTGIVYPTDES
ncbi:Gfo/Idh/MocA family protein [Paenibacillus sp. CMAA1364]